MRELNAAIYRERQQYQWPPLSSGLLGGGSKSKRSGQFGSRLCRKKAAQDGQHKRTPEVQAKLYIGFRVFIAFAEDVAAVSKSEAEGFRQRAWQALRGVAEAQKEFRTGDPVRQFLDALQACFMGGSCYVNRFWGNQKPDGEKPTNSRAWGWLQDYPRGDLVGWLDETRSLLFIQPLQTYSAVQKFLNNSGQSLSVGEATLRKRLLAAGVLAEHDDKRQTKQIRVGTHPQRVLALRADCLRAE